MVAALLATLAPTSAAAKPRPDLVIANLGVAPSMVVAGGTLRVTETTRNKGRRAARASVTRYYLSKNRKVDRKDIVLAQRKVKRLKALAKASVKKRTMRVPLTTKPGKYRLIACADAKTKVRETNERNNCRVAKRRVTVKAAKKGPTMPYDGALKVAVQVTADHWRWDHSDTPGNNFAHQEDTSIRYTGSGDGWLMLRDGKPDQLTWQWSRAEAAGTVTYLAQGEGTGIAECPFWNSQGSVTSAGSAISTQHAGGMIAAATSSLGLRADMGLSHDLGSVEVDKIACGDYFSKDRTLRLALKPYWWFKKPTITLGWSADRMTVSYHKRGTVNDPSYSEQGWEERGTVKLTRVD